MDGADNSIDIDYQSDPEHVTASWFTIEDPESGIVDLTLCIGSKPGTCDIKSAMVIKPTDTKASTYVPRMSAGEKYFVALFATNGAGSTTVMVSDGVVIDYTVPVAGHISLGNGGGYLADGDIIEAQWSGFEDPESGIKFYQIALCEKVNTTNCIVSFVDAGKETNISFSGLSNYLFFFRFCVDTYT